MEHFVIVGAEGAAESVGVLPYVRRATEEESMAQTELVRKTRPEMDIRGLLIDPTGRPYFWLAVDVDHPDCPETVRTRVRNFLRMVRLDG